MEIERKWLVQGWPEGLPAHSEYRMRQGYLCVRPTVRIREEALQGGDTRYILCLKSEGGLAREEVEMELSPRDFSAIENGIIGEKKPLIEKVRRCYALPGELELEVNHVDAGQPGEFWYAEVEFGSVEQANAFSPEALDLGGFLVNEVTEQPGQSMGAYWIRTREKAE